MTMGTHPDSSPAADSVEPAGLDPVVRTAGRDCRWPGHRRGAGWLSVSSSRNIDVGLDPGRAQF